MQTSFKRILALSMLPVAVLLFSGCGSSTKPATTAPTGTPTVTPTTATTNQEKVPTPAELAPLPADDKQAINAEISGIDQALQDTDKALDADTPDGELGL